MAPHGARAREPNRTCSGRLSGGTAHPRGWSRRARGLCRRPVPPRAFGGDGAGAGRNGSPGWVWVRPDEQRPGPAPRCSAFRGTPPAPPSGAGPGPAADGTTPSEGGETLEAPAAGHHGAHPRTRVAVLILASHDVDSGIADALSEVAIGAVAAHGGVSIVGKEEVQAEPRSGGGALHRLLELHRVPGPRGRALEVDQVVAGTIGRRGDTWIFNLNRIDIRSGRLVGRAFREVQGGLGSVAAAIQAAIPTLYEVTRRPATLLLGANVEGAELSVDGVLVGIYRGDPVRIGDLTAGRHEIAVNAPAHYEWKRVVNVVPGATLQIDASLDAVSRRGGLSPFLWIGAGVLVAGGATATAFGISSQRTPAQGTTRADAVDFASARRTDALVANIAVGAAAAGLVTGLVGLLLSDFGGDTSHGSDVAVGIGPSGARLEGSF